MYEMFSFNELQKYFVSSATINYHRLERSIESNVVVFVLQYKEMNELVD